MNDAHLQFLSSPDWARMLETDLLPWVDGVGDLGDDVLEIGPGPGLTTDLLRQRAARITAVEIDDSLASALRERLEGTNVEVVHADASTSGLPSNRFTGAACFSMLHHVPSAETQDSVLAEVCRMLQPGGLFVASDAADSDLLRDFHEDDVFVPVDPATLPDRLARAGFDAEAVEIEVGELELRFSARKPGGRARQT